MQNRRKFLLQTTLATGSVMFLKPLKTLAFSPAAASSSSAEKLTILHLNTLQNKFQKVLGASPLGRLTGLFNSKPSNTLLLSTGNIMGSKNTPRAQHIEKLTWLRRAGCDAIVPNASDLENGFAYCNELTNECKLTSLSGDAQQIANSNVLPYHITYKGNIKIGIVGNGTNSPLNNNAKKIASKLNQTAAILKTNYGCQLVISMNPCHNNSNTTYKNQEREIAALTTNVDIMVSGNPHHKNPVTYVIKNALHNEVVLNYQGVKSAHVKGIDISFNDKNEKTHIALRDII